MEEHYRFDYAIPAIEIYFLCRPILMPNPGRRPFRKNRVLQLDLKSCGQEQYHLKPAESLSCLSMTSMASMMRI
jgi:hypothetical protein